MLEDRLGEDARITVLGHVQRGGAPSAFDRNLSTMLGAEAIEAITSMDPNGEPLIVGMQGNKLTRTRLDVYKRQLYGSHPVIGLKYVYRCQCRLASL